MQRTAEDDNFIDNEDDDHELLNEYNQDRQDFRDDERPEGHRKGRKGRDDDDDDELELQDDDPFNAALRMIQGSGRRAKDMSSEDKDRICQELLFQMDKHAKQDAEDVRRGRPATQKLKLLPQIAKALKNRSLHQPLLDFDLLNVIALWLQPTPSGALPSLTMRTQMLESLRELPIQPEHLRSSGLGKQVMAMLRHADETPENKLAARRLVEAWSRPIMGRSLDAKEAEKRHERPAPDASRAPEQRARHGADDVVEMCARAEARQPHLAEGARVRMPEHKGFDFSARPAASNVDQAQSAKFARIKWGENSKKGKLDKRMQEMNRPIQKNVRSSTMSIEGRGQHKIGPR